MPSINVIFNEWKWHHIRLYYLVVADNIFDKNQISANLSPGFESVTYGYAKAYIEKGEMPPPEIAPAILNMADDYLSGREVTIRAGDYIAIQNHMRKGARPTS